MLIERDYKEFLTKITSVMKEGIKKHLPVTLDSLGKSLIESARKRVHLIKKGSLLFMVKRSVNRTPTEHPLLNRISPLSFRDITPPDVSDIKEGRCNLEGELHWYLADDIKTAIVEAGTPSNSDLTVVEYCLKEDLNVVDLINVKDMILCLSDQGPNKWDDVAWSYIQSFFQTPVSFNKNVYNVCNYLIQIFKLANFQGVAWKSSMRNGECLVLFKDFSREEVKTEHYVLISIEPNTAPLLD